MYKHYSDGRRRFLKMSALFGTAALISPAIARAEGGGADSPENGGFAASRAEILLNRQDPGCVVIDELVGQWVTMLCLGSFSPWLRSHGNDLQPQPVSLA